MNIIIIDSATRFTGSTGNVVSFAAYAARRSGDENFLQSPGTDDESRVISLAEWRCRWGLSVV